MLNNNYREENYVPQHDSINLMILYNQEVKKHPELPDAQTRLLRARLIFEEAMEYVDASGCVLSSDGMIVLDTQAKPDLIEMADAIGDILVVTYGAANSCGIAVQPVWDEIQESNESKAFPHCSICDEELIEEKPMDKNTEYAYCHSQIIKHGKYDVIWKLHKREDGKIIKYPGYYAANIKSVLERQ